MRCGEIKKAPLRALNLLSEVPSPINVACSVSRFLLRLSEGKGRRLVFFLYPVNGSNADI